MDLNKKMPKTGFRLVGIKNKIENWLKYFCHSFFLQNEYWSWCFTQILILLRHLITKPTDRLFLFKLDSKWRVKLISFISYYHCMIYFFKIKISSDGTFILLVFESIVQSSRTLLSSILLVQQGQMEQKHKEVVL